MQKEKIFNDFGATNRPRSKCFKCHFVEEDGDVYICMIFRANSIVKKAVIDVLDKNRKPIQPNLRAGNIYIYGASGTIFQPNVKNSHPDIINSEKYGDFDA